MAKCKALTGSAVKGLNGMSREAQTLRAAINFRQQNSNLNDISQAQRSASKITTFIRLTETNRIHYRAKLHQNMTIFSSRG